jgi:hypothetical protein
MAATNSYNCRTNINIDVPGITAGDSHTSNIFMLQFS